jgi:hypothetical protein
MIKFFINVKKHPKTFKEYALYTENNKKGLCIVDGMGSPG